MRWPMSQSRRLPRTDFPAAQTVTARKRKTRDASVSQSRVRRVGAKGRTDSAAKALAAPSSHLAPLLFPTQDQTQSTAPCVQASACQPCRLLRRVSIVAHAHALGNPSFYIAAHPADSGDPKPHAGGKLPRVNHAMNRSLGQSNEAREVAHPQDRGRGVDRVLFHRAVSLLCVVAPLSARTGYTIQRACRWGMVL